ncbi:MAG: tRNA-(ms[2]io[6]A)-hydroxylase [bacterium]|nr:tRNA-(ms[2]io[6]A)-hydroxylase [bacterium]
MLKLASATDPAWADRVLWDLPEVLLDHAHCEKKAAGVPVRLIFQYPQHAFMMEPLAGLAREELAHFEEVLGWLERKGLQYRRQRPSAYAGQLRRIVRAQEPMRLIDILLCCAVIEARSFERLGLLASAVDEEPLGRFWEALRKAESRHHRVYVDLACKLAPRDEVADRLEVITHHEAAILADAQALPRLHS